MKSFLAGWFLLFVLVLLLPVETRAQAPADDPGFWEQSTHNAQWFMIGADLGTTWYGIQKDHRIEANKFLVKIAEPFKPEQRMAVQSLAVISMSAVSDVVNHKKFKDNPKIRILLRSVVLGVHAFAVYNNLK